MIMIMIMILSPALKLGRAVAGRCWRVGGGGGGVTRTGGRVTRRGGAVAGAGRGVGGGGGTVAGRCRRVLRTEF